MTNSQRLTIRLSECRQRLNELLGIAERTDEQTGELEALTGEVTKLEPELRAAIAAEGATDEAGGDVPDRETRERLELRGRSRVGAWIAAAVRGTALDGPEAEYAAACGAAPGEVPLDLFEPPPETRARETRDVTPGPSATAFTSTRPTVPFAFSRTAAAALGVTFPSVGPGQANYPQLTTAPTVGAVGKGEAVPDTAGAFGLATRTPKRVGGAFDVRVEDVALFPSMEADLRMALIDALGSGVDDGVLTGDGQGDNLAGLLSVAADVAADGATVTYATAVAKFAALVDGKHAADWSDLRAVVGVQTFAKLAGLTNQSDVSAFDYLAARMGALRVSDRMPAVASNAQKGLVVRSAQMQPITVPAWATMEIQPDPYSQSKRGIRTLTIFALLGDPFTPYGTAQVVEVHPKLS